MEFFQNLESLEKDEMLSTNGGWLGTLGGALGVALALGEIAYEFGHSLGESYKAAIE